MQIIIAIASDDELMEQLVLKGGNALELVHNIGSRASLDLDFSIEEDFGEPDVIRDRLFRALDDRFNLAGFVVFKKEFFPRPKVSAQPGSKWGGYTARFKLISHERYQELDGNEEAMAREAQVTGPGQHRTFTIQISKFEYCEGRMEAEVDDYIVYVYTPAMIAAEKLRALCQQMREYQQRLNPTPRPRDFYDIHAIVANGGVVLHTPDNMETIRQMFKAKDVRLESLDNLESYREFHRTGWESVVDAVRGATRDYDFYFDFVLDLVRELQPLWVV